MSDLADQLRQDRAMRDAARALVKTDIAYLKGEFGSKSIGARVAARVSEGATDLYEEAAGLASDNKGILITLLAAVGLWFTRNPLMELFLDPADDPEGSEDHEYDEHGGEDDDRQY